jgi:hypothetical protein
MRHDRARRPMRSHDRLHRFRALDDRGASRLEITRSDSLWLGRSNAMTRCPASTSGFTKTPRCARQPPHPCTRYIAGPSPHASPAIRCPDQTASTGSPDETPGGMRRLISTAGGVTTAQPPTVRPLEARSAQAHQTRGALSAKPAARCQSPSRLGTTQYREPSARPPLFHECTRISEQPVFYN